jgi:hypothetical protein
MGKRSNMPKVERDFYPTPAHAVEPLLPHLSGSVLFSEPCCGDGALIMHLHKAGHSCIFASDVAPRMNNATTVSAMRLNECRGDMFITNPPYTWKVLDPLITHLRGLAPTWLLLPADMMHNKRMSPHLEQCHKIVSVGRVKWFGSGGMENSAWYLFLDHSRGPTEFYGR